MANQKVNTVAAPVQNTPVTKMEALRASLLLANQKRAEARKAELEALAIEKEFANEKQAILNPLKDAALKAILDYKSMASKEEMTALHAILFPRVKSGKVRKARTPKLVVTESK